jgi:hypothetical protein
LNDREQHPSGIEVEAKDESEKARPFWRRLRKWAFVLVPLVGLLELAVHLVQIEGGVDESDWRAARDVVKTLAHPEDLVLVAPRWVDPLGREYLGSDVLTVEREARADETGFPRAIQVSFGRARAPELRGWKLSAEQRVGGLIVATLENPTPVRILDRLLAHQGPERMRVSQVSRGQETECPYTRGAAQAGSLGFGPAVPGQLFMCPGGGFVGVSIIATLDYTPRRCFYAPITSAGTGLRVHFKDVVLGRTLHGHHALYVEAERSRAGAPITLDVSVDDQALAHLIHYDGEGWKAFDVATDVFAGQRKDLVFDIKSGDGNRRMYCFEADTR